MNGARRRTNPDTKGTNVKKSIILFACLVIAFPAFAKNEKKAKNQKKLPSGLEKKLERGGELPPGWQKKLAKGEILEQDMYASAKRVSDVDMKKYPKSESGSELLQLEDKIIRIKKDTKEILEVFGI